VSGLTKTVNRPDRQLDDWWRTEVRPKGGWRKTQPVGSELNEGLGPIRAKFFAYKSPSLFSKRNNIFVISGIMKVVFIDKSFGDNQ
jgi:hypothetical protein